MTAHAHHLEELYPAIGNMPVGFTAYVYLLDSIGSIYLPRALKWLADSLAEGHSFLRMALRAEAGIEEGGW